MAEKVLLASYAVTIKNNKENAYLSSFNGVEDFFQVLKDFTISIIENVNKFKDKDGGENIFLTLEELPKFNDDERILYGYFSSGIRGEDYKIKDLENNETLLNVDRKKHASFRDVFFYFYIPKNKDLGYLILQRKVNFGIKTKLAPALNSYLAEKGYTKNYLKLDNIIHASVYKKMMKHGKLKKVELIKRKIPKNLEDFFNNDQNLDEIKGYFRTSFSASDLPNSWKGFIDELISKNRNSTITIGNLDDSYDDLEFQLELNGKNKTFYIKNEHRTQPDIDVTNNVDFLDGNPTTESLVKNAAELIEDVLNLKPNV